MVLFEKAKLHKMTVKTLYYNVATVSFSKTHTEISLLLFIVFVDENTETETVRLFRP